MGRKKSGFILFWIGLIWAFFWGILGSIHQYTFYGHILTFEEFNQSIWSTTGPLMSVWGCAPPLGALVAGIGLLLYSGVKGSTVWKFGIGIFLAVIIISVSIGFLGHFPFLYAIGGTLILLSFFGILWLWAKERMSLKGTLATAADLKLAGYVFLVIGMWYTCGIASPQWIKAFVDQPPMKDPIIVKILFALGLLFIFLGYYKSRK